MIISTAFLSNQDGSLHRLHSQHSPPRQRNVDNLLQTGTQTEQLARALPSPHPQHSVEWQSTQRSGRASLSTMFTLLRQRRLRWLGHVCRMEDDRIPKDILYGELAPGKRTVGHPQLRIKDLCKCDIKALDINTEGWEDAAADRSRRRSVLRKQLKSGEEKILTTAIEKRARRKARILGVIPT